MNKNKIQIGEFDSFEALRKFCEALERLGYRLNVLESCYER